MNQGRWREQVIALISSRWGVWAADWRTQACSKGQMEIKRERERALNPGNKVPLEKCKTGTIHKWNVRILAFSFSPQLIKVSLSHCGSGRGFFPAGEILNGTVASVLVQRWLLVFVLSLDVILYFLNQTLIDKVDQLICPGIHVLLFFLSDSPWFWSIFF